MMQEPEVFVALAWRFAPDVFPQSPQNVAIYFSLHHPSCWNKFLMHVAFNVKKTYFTLLLICLVFFGRGEVGVFR